MKRIVVLLPLLLMGCQSYQPNTPSGKAEVTIHRATVEVVKSAIVNKALSDGWMVTTDSTFMLQLERREESFAAQLLLGSGFNRVPNRRKIYSFAQLGDDSRVVVEMAMVTNPGSAFEQRMFLDTGEVVKGMQDDLDQNLQRDVDALRPKKK